jgi:flagellar hook-basal body complex protein FliE
VIPAIPASLGQLDPSEWSVTGVGGTGATGTAGTDQAAPASGSGSFGNALSSAINSLDQTQNTAAAASQGLATGTLTDPTQAVTAVENASLSMDLASQIRDKLVTAESTIFNTQV